MSKSFLKTHKTILHDGVTAAGTSVITPSTGVDSVGYERVVFIVAWGAITGSGVQSIEVHQCDTLAGTYAALLGSDVAVADDDDNKVTIVEIYRPIERFLKCVVNRATQNSAVASILCVLSGGTATTSQDATVSGTETHSTPIEGTA